MTTALTDEDTQAPAEGDFGPDFNVPHDTSETDDPADAPDPDAPYGRNPKTGKPYRYSKEERERRAAMMNAARWGNRPPKPKAPGRTSSAAPKSKGPDYRAGVAQLLQIPALALGIAARFTGSPALALDSATVTLHAPALADAGAQLAEQHEWVRTALDKAMAAGPYSAGLVTLLPFALQLAANHGKIPANPDMGILDGESLMAALQQQGAG